MKNFLKNFLKLDKWDSLFERDYVFVYVLIIILCLVVGYRIWFIKYVIVYYNLMFVKFYCDYCDNIDNLVFIYCEFFDCDLIYKLLIFFKMD